jgi:L-asparaginase
MQIHIITTGGTIDKRYAPNAACLVEGPPAATEILRQANLNVDCRVESLMSKDSLDITAADRQRIVDRVASSPCRQIIVTHGTDTLLETALALRAVPHKVIVLTGAMQPACCRESDAAFNLGGAVIAVQTLPPGVHVVMSGRVWDPAHARKNRAESRFEAIDVDPSPR